MVLCLPEEHKWSDHARVYYKAQRKSTKKAQINGKDYWISSNGKHAIWFDKKFENWKIGYERNKGTSKCAIYSIPTGVKSPLEIGKKWASLSIFPNGQTHHSNGETFRYKDDDIEIKNFTGIVFASFFRNDLVKPEILNPSLNLSVFMFRSISEKRIQVCLSVIECLDQYTHGWIFQ